MLMCVQNSTEVLGRSRQTSPGGCNTLKVIHQIKNHAYVSMVLANTITKLQQSVSVVTRNNRMLKWICYHQIKLHLGNLRNKIFAETMYNRCRFSRQPTCIENVELDCYHESMEFKDMFTLLWMLGCRTGKRTTMGLLQDGYNSAIRYFMNNFYDGFRQVSSFISHILAEHLKKYSPSCRLVSE